ncbi:MAG: tetratricopeptide repeat protein [Gemmatimonadota bacterium]|nr:tetratricopeptide repeat protein [Gemmatimonadota bacterium]
MSRPSLFESLKRARVFQVLVVYLGAAWFLLQLVDTLQGMLALPDAVGPVTIVLLMVGLFVVVATAWVQSLPSTNSREEAGEVPTDWQVAPRDILRSLRAGRLPHLTWGRAIMGGVVALSLLFGGAGLVVLLGDGSVGFGSLGPTPAGATEAATGIAVVPFSVNSDELDVWREGMVDLLSTNVDGLGGFRAISSRTVLARWGSFVKDDEVAGLDDALRVAGGVGARYALVGSAVSLGGRVRLTAELYDVSDGSKVGQAVQEGTEDEVLRMAESLAVEVVKELLENQGSEHLVSESQVASLSTHSLEALRSYLEGEALIRHGEYERAATAFEEAVGLDSTFASAYHRLVETYGWMEAGGDRADRAELALRALRESLPPRDRVLLEGREALMVGDVAGGIRIMEEATRRYPDDPDAWALLGEFYVHGGDQQLRMEEDRWTAYSQAVRLDSTFGPSYIHLVETAMHLQWPDTAARLLEAYTALAPGSHQATALRLGWDVQFGGDEARTAAFAAMDTLGVHTAGDMTNGLAFTPAGLDAWGTLAEVMWNRTRSPRWQADRLRVLVARGRLAEARDLVGSAEGRLGARGAFLQDLAEVSAWVPVGGTDGCEAGPECLLLTGVKAVDRGDPALLAEVREALESRRLEETAGGHSGRPAVIAGVESTLDAYDLLRGDDLHGARSALEAVTRVPGISGWESALARLWLGRIAREEGRTADAIRYFRSLEPGSDLGWYGVLLQARAHRDDGDDVAARAEYGRFLEYWSDAPRDHPFVTEAVGGAAPH